MDNKPPTNPAAGDKKSASSSSSKPSYISSSGHVLETPPLTARLSRASDAIYNFLGLYFVSLFSLDPYTAAQNSQFNLRGRPNAYQERARWGNSNGINQRLGGGGGGGGGSGHGAGGPGNGGAGGGRRMGGIDDVRGPECQSCG